MAGLGSVKPQVSAKEQPAQALVNVNHQVKNLNDHSILDGFFKLSH
jgi:hypothetical protein